MARSSLAVRRLCAALTELKAAADEALRELDEANQREYGNDPAPEPPRKVVEITDVDRANARRGLRRVRGLA